MEWAQAITIILSVMGGFYFFFSRLDTEVKSMRFDLRDQGKRVDRVYEMFIDLLKNQKKE